VPLKEQCATQPGGTDGGRLVRRPERGNGQGANRLLPEDRPAHGWYRFVLSFPPHLVRDYLGRFGVGPDHLVLDPFCGTGTTLVEAKKLGIRSVGLDANPMARFASQVKVDWSPDPDLLRGHARRVAERAVRQLAAEGLDDAPLGPKFGQACSGNSGRPHGHPLRALPPELEKLLLTDSISPLPLHKTLALLDALEDLRDARFHGHERLALAKALVCSVSNLRFGPEVGVGPAKPDAAVVAAWLAEVEAIADDLRGLARAQHRPPAPAARALQAQARAQLLEGEVSRGTPAADRQARISQMARSFRHGVCAFSPQNPAFPTTSC
jgi:hypothetical protein